MEDSAQRRWSGAVRGAIRDIAAKPDDMTRRGGAASRTHGSSAFQKQSARISGLDFFSRSVSAEMGNRTTATGTLTPH